MNQTLTHRAGKHLVVTRIEQFTVPAYLHGDDIRDAIVSGDGYVSIDFHSFKCAMQPLPGRNTRDIIYGKALEYFRELGVHLEGGTYVNIGWVEADKHRPMQKENVLVVNDDMVQFTAYWCYEQNRWEQYGSPVGGITHWRRLPALPQHEKELEKQT